MPGYRRVAMEAAAEKLDLSPLTPQTLESLSNPIRQFLACTPYAPPESNPVSVKSLLEALLPSPNPHSSEPRRDAVVGFCLCCAALASAEGEDSPYVYWITGELSALASGAVRGLACAVGLEEGVLLERLMPEVFPVLKGVIKESCVDIKSEDFMHTSEKKHVTHAIVAAHQFRWFVTKINYPHLGKLCSLVIPCALTALDHWSPEVKDQGMICFIHLGKNVNSAELCWFEEPILDACARNIASTDELWERVTEMSVLLLTCLLRRNPRNPWYERILSEMLSHLERQPMNKDRRIAWLLLIEPVLNAMGIFILAHLKRIFALFFLWFHADDDKTVILALERMRTVIKLTWIRRSPNFDKLVDEMVTVYKEAAMRKDREPIHTHILQILTLLKQCKGQNFEIAWDKHKNDHNLASLVSLLS